MAEETNEAASRVADALAGVCGQLDSLRALLPDDDEGSPLEKLLEAVRAGQDPAGPLDALHTALLAAGDHLGVYGNTRSLRPMGSTATRRPNRCTCARRPGVRATAGPKPPAGRRGARSPASRCAENGCDRWAAC